MTRFIARIPPIVLVAVGGGLGSLTRVAASSALTDRCAPWIATTAINLVGSVAAGVVWSRLSRATSALPTRRLALSAFALAGFLGGFTTFSGFGLQTAQLAGAGDLGPAIWNFWIALVVAVAGALGGVALERRLRR